MYFLPRQTGIDFYFKLILPFVACGILIRGSYGEIKFSHSEASHVKAAKNNLDLNRSTPIAKNSRHDQDKVDIGNHV